MAEKIEGWHERAAIDETDHYINFMLNYLSFISILDKKYKDLDTNKKKIQRLKQDEDIKEKFIYQINNNRNNKNIIRKLIHYLKYEPIKSATNVTDN
jgi:hypothetical protein